MGGWGRTPRLLVDVRLIISFGRREDDACRASTVPPARSAPAEAFLAAGCRGLAAVSLVRFGAGRLQPLDLLAAAPVAPSLLTFSSSASSVSGVPARRARRLAGGGLCSLTHCCFSRTTSRVCARLLTRLLTAASNEPPIAGLLRGLATPSPLKDAALRFVFPKSSGSESSASKSLAVEALRESSRLRHGAAEAGMWVRGVYVVQAAGGVTLTSTDGASDEFVGDVGRTSAHPRHQVTSGATRRRR